MIEEQMKPKKCGPDGILHPGMWVLVYNIPSIFIRWDKQAMNAEVICDQEVMWVPWSIMKRHW